MPCDSIFARSSGLARDDAAALCSRVMTVEGVPAGAKMPNQKVDSKFGRPASSEPGMPGIANDIKKPGMDEHGYPKTPLKAAASMFAGYAELRRDLPRITIPVLFFRSAEDHVVDISSSRALNAGLSSKDFEERVLEDSYHVATLDNDAPRIFAESAEFIERVTAAERG